MLTNMAVSIEQHADWVLDCLDHLGASGFDVIEPTEMAEAGWTQHVNDCADITLYPAANSWYMGANVPGKPRVFLPYCGGLDFYRVSLRRGGRPGLPGLHNVWPQRLAVQRRSGAPAATGRRDGHQRGGGDESAAAGIDGRGGRPRLLRADVDGSTAGTRGRRDCRRCPAGHRRRSGVPVVPSAHPGPASDRRVLPWGRLRFR